MSASKKRRKSKRKAVKSITGELADPAGGSPWDDVKEKQRAYLEIMRKILANPDLGETYRKSDDEAAKAFKCAGMNVPPDVKVVFVKAGDTLKLGTGSAVIELPPANTALTTSDSDLLELFLCTYTLQW